MVIGAARVELRIHGARSLKEKRGVVRSVVRRVRNRFNAAVVEVDGQDTWQRAVLGLSVVALDGGTARSLLERIVDFVEDLHLAEVVDQEAEVLAMGAEPSWQARLSPWPGELDEDEAENG
jgi:uncharacterized protein YlxP (DUF503 family)